MPGNGCCAHLQCCHLMMILCLCPRHSPWWEPPPGRSCRALPAVPAASALCPGHRSTAEDRSCLSLLLLPAAAGAPEEGGPEEPSDTPVRVQPLTNASPKLGVFVVCCCIINVVVKLDCIHLLGLGDAKWNTLWGVSGGVTEAWLVPYPFFSGTVLLCFLAGVNWAALLHHEVPALEPVKHGLNSLNYETYKFFLLWVVGVGYYVSGTGKLTNVAYSICKISMIKMLQNFFGEFTEYDTFRFFYYI